jgi:Raf kinase inhibitor-like YbhB/YbcL family protein
MQLKSRSFKDGAEIPGEFAFRNRNPDLMWSDAPGGAKSFAVICHDHEVPSRGDDVNQEGREVSGSLPRIDFLHWLLLDIPATIRQIAAGSQSDGIVPRGKPGPVAPDGLRHGINDFTSWFAADADMSGVYYGYDRPCPPWDDVFLHHYVFTLYALDVRHLQTRGDLTGSERARILSDQILQPRRCRIRVSVQVGRRHFRPTVVGMRSPVSFGMTTRQLEHDRYVNSRPRTDLWSPMRFMTGARHAARTPPKNQPWQSPR